MEQLWSKRLSAFIEQRIFILRRVANGFAFLPIIVIMFGLYYYPILLAAIPNDFPIQLVIAIIVAFSVARGSYRSFLLESDVVYLTPIESRLKAFFFKTYIYNVIVQLFFVFAFLVILSPLFFNQISDQLLYYVLFVAVVLLLKVWNVLLLWNELKGESKAFVYIRWLLNGVILYGILLQQLLLIVCSFILLIGMYWLIQSVMKSERIHWLHLIQVEQQLDAQFYRWMVQFVEHPYIESKVKPRRVITMMTNHIPLKQENAFAYLYAKLFLRTETIGIVFRITLIGMVTLLFIFNPYVAYVFYVMLIIMIGMQLSAFWQSYNNNFWLGLYPLAQRTLRQDFVAASYYIMLICAILIPIPALFVQFSWLHLLIFSLLALVVPFVYIRLYMAKKMI